MNGDKNITTIDITTFTFLRVILLGLLLAFLYYLRDIVAVVLFSIVIASAIEPAAHWFKRHHIPRLGGVIIIYLLAFTIIGGIFYLIVPPLFSEVSDFIATTPLLLDTNTLPQTVVNLLPSLPGSISNIILDVLTGLEDSLAEAASGFFQATATVFGGALSLVLIIVISFYLSVQEHGIENFLRIITPRTYENYVLDLWERSRRKIGLWLQGQLLLGVMVGVMTFLGLTILGVKYALFLAIMVTVFELIPTFGPIISAIPAILIAFLQSPGLALAVLILYVIVHQFESHLIYPLVVKKTVGVPPILVVIALIVGAKLGGIFGILLAVPIAAVLVEFVHDLALKKRIAE